METGKPHFHMGSLMKWLPVSIWGSPYGNGDRHIACKFPFPYGYSRFHMGSAMKQIPVFIWWSPYGNGDRQIPIWKRASPISIWGAWWQGSPFLCGDHHMETGTCLHTGIVLVTNPFPNRVCYDLGIEVKIPKWEYLPQGDHHFHMVIPIWKWAGRQKKSHKGTPHFQIEFVPVWGPTNIPP